MFSVVCVCQSVHRMGVHLVTTTHNVIGQSWLQGDTPQPSILITGVTPPPPRPGPSDMFKLFHFGLTVQGPPPDWLQRERLAFN